MYRSNNNWLYKNEKVLPYIRLTGVWLQKVGFEIGQEICVEVKNKQLIITVKDKK